MDTVRALAAVVNEFGRIKRSDMSCLNCLYAGHSKSSDSFFDECFWGHVKLFVLDVLPASMNVKLPIRFEVLVPLPAVCHM